MNKAELHRAQAEAIAARERFMRTLHELQHRLKPATIVSDVKEMAKEKADVAVTAAKGGVAQAQRNPGKTAAFAAPVVLLLFRKPLWRGVKALFGGRPDEEPALQPYEEARHSAPLTTEPAQAPARVPETQGA